MKKNKSISWSIWFSILKILLLVFVLLIVINTTLLKGFKDEFIYEHLEEVAEHKLEKYLRNEIIEHSDVYHYLIITQGDNYSIQSDSFTKNRYGNNVSILSDITDLIVTDHKKKGKIRQDNSIHYFYTEKINNNETIVFLKTISKEPPLTIKYLFYAMIVLLSSLLISRYIAKKIATPIKKLELFSREISKRNWDAIMPESEDFEFHQLGITMREMQLALKKSEERDREFIQSSSHDLKTPVMIIKGYAQAISDGVEIKVNDDLAQVILNEADRLEKKIEHLLQMNTLDYSLQVNNLKETVRIDRIIKNLVEHFSTIRTDIKWDISLIDVECLGNPEILRVALENILDNQIRYACQIITIKMTSNSILIGNDGPQFEVNDPSQLFEQYHKDVNGHFGLGLFISKRIFDAHNIQLTAQNIDNGVIFKIKIPS